MNLAIMIESISRANILFHVKKQRLKRKLKPLMVKRT